MRNIRICGACFPPMAAFATWRTGQGRKMQLWGVRAACSTLRKTGRIRLPRAVLCVLSPPPALPALRGRGAGACSPNLPPRGRGMTKRIPSDNRILAKHATAIRRLGKRVVADVIEIGRLLTECKRICGHGNWLPWLDREFGWTDDTALNFMRVYELSKSRNFRDLSLPLSGLYLLAAPSTPQEARDEIIERAQAGETIPVAEAKRIIEHAKNQQQPSSKPDKPTTKPQANIADDFDADSRTEAERLRVRVEELQAQVRQRDIKITGLESEIEELRGKLATGTGGDMSVSEFQTA